MSRWGDSGRSWRTRSISGRARSSGCNRDSPATTDQQPRYAGADVVTDCANLLQRQIFRILKRPVITLQTWDVWTLVAASHGHELRGLLGERFCKQLRPTGVEVDTHLP